MPNYIPDDIDFAEYLNDTETKQHIRPAYEFVNDAKEHLANFGKGKRIFLPWAKTIYDFDFRPGELTIWAGQNSHGKTDVTTQVALSLAAQNQKICVASFEMKPVTTIGRMVRMFSGTNPFSQEYQNSAGIDSLYLIYNDFAEWSKNKIWLYDHTGTAKSEAVLGMVKYCGDNIGVTHVFIDSLMKCVANEDDFNGQKLFIDRLCALAKDLALHVHVVHHLRKPAKETDMPDKHDTKGSGSITDQADNVFMVWRNKRKEEDVRQNGSMAKMKNDPDAYLLCRKQRNYVGSADGEPSIGLWRHKDAGCFVEQVGAGAINFESYPHGTY